MQGRFFRLSLRQNFSLPSILEHRRTCDRTARAALHRRLNVGLSSYAPAQTRQAHRQPSPLKRVEFASKLQEKIHAANAAEHRENFAARKIQPRPAVRPDMTECGTAQKNAYLSNFKTTAAETANTPARFALKQYRRVQNAAQTACRRIRLNSDLS